MLACYIWTRQRSDAWEAEQRARKARANAARSEAAKEQPRATLENGRRSFQVRYQMIPHLKNRQFATSTRKQSGIK
jgi:hypothetical protein